MANEIKKEEEMEFKKLAGKDIFSDVEWDDIEKSFSSEPAEKPKSE